MTTSTETEGLRVRRDRLFGQQRPADVVIGELGMCQRRVRRNLADANSPEDICAAITAWRRNGKLWCPRCWSATPEGLAAVAKLDGAGSEGDR